MLTLASLKNEIGDGIVFIFGGVTDAFGAAQEEMSIVTRDRCFSITDVRKRS